MSRLRRAILIWLLALALPVQALAASAMLFCGAGLHPSDQAASMTADLPASDQGVELPEDSSASASTRGEVAQASLSTHDSAHHHHSGADASGGALGTGADHGACSACGDCCSVLALPAPREPSVADQPGQALQPSAVASWSLQPAGRLDRPPRPAHC